ncbi:MAG: amidophosphoribosyltransferase [Ignavibacteriales bacterium]|nr:amidophosphoribosyltransferase [Melioribacteraceae bacterium]MCF8435373.1 amidophosphoribosyltransferase [Ignavibacteriales bacterium]
MIRIVLDKPTCNCGIFGFYGSDDASLNIYYGLHALQHRGQEASGIISSCLGKKPIFNIHKGFGLVSEVFANKKIFRDKLSGDYGIGHNRYSTTGASDSIKNIQPFAVNYRLGNLAIAHNGNLTNASQLRTELIEAGSIFQTSSDTEILLHLIAKSKLNDQVEQVKEALNIVQGAFSFLIMMDGMIIGARDRHGFRPLCLGKLNDSYIITSETCALDIISAEYIRDIEPGEMVVIDKSVIETGKVKSYQIFDQKETPKHCIFEYIYFSRPDSKIFGTSVDKLRRKLGKVLARNHPVRDKDGEKVIVISVPDSSNTAAIGYQGELEKNGINSKLEIGLIRSHYIGRTFILPGQSEREIGVKIKFNTVKGVLEGKTVVLIDDSIVRGTTSRQLVNLIKEANPKEIHIRISSPPITHPCFYGMDFPSSDELIANKFNSNIEEIRQYLGVNSLAYLTNDELLEAMIDHQREEFCTACFTGNYPVPVNTNFVKVAND